MKSGTVSLLVNLSIAFAVIFGMYCLFEGNPFHQPKFEAGECAAYYIVRSDLDRDGEDWQIAKTPNYVISIVRVGKKLYLFKKLSLVSRILGQAPELDEEKIAYLDQHTQKIDCAEAVHILEGVNHEH